MTQEIQYLHLLARLVRCQPCGTEMTAIHDPDNRYVCPTLVEWGPEWGPERGPDNCTTPPIDAEYLDRLAATRLRRLGLFKFARFPGSIRGELNAPLD